MPHTPVLLVIAGPAGSGKSTLCDRLVHEVPAFERVITTTTRAPRACEINGVHYHFFPPDDFRRKVTAGDFSHRIAVTGHDQLADLSSSFNGMTENLQRLFVVEKEKLLPYVRG